MKLLTKIFLFYCLFFLLNIPLIVADEFDFGEETFNLEEEKEIKPSYFFPIRGKLGVEFGRQTDKKPRLIKFGPSLNVILDWHPTYTTVYGEFTLKHNQAYRIENDSRETVDNFENEYILRELYINKSFSNYTLIIGQNIVVWGKNDFLSVLDVVTPTDQTEFVFAKPEEARLGQLLIKLDHWSGKNQITALVSPYPLMNRLPEHQHPYTFYSYDYEEKRGSVEGGLRFNREFSNTSVALLTGHFYNRNPMLETDSDLKIKKKFKQYDIFGLTIARVITPIMLKMEIARFNKRPYQLISNSGMLEIKHVDTTALSLGFDYNHDKWGAFTIETNFYLPDQVDAQVTKVNLFALGWSKALLNDTLTLSLTQIGFESYANMITRAGFSWNLTDSIKITSQYTFIQINRDIREYKIFEDFDRFDAGLFYYFDW